MAKRPTFIVNDSLEQPVKVDWIEFTWVPGMSKKQKQKCVDSLHLAIQQKENYKTLEISSKSRDSLGVNLSAFNLGFFYKGKFISVESAFQGSKVFEYGGPFPELYERNARDAKRFFKENEFGPLTEFSFFNQSWALEPKTAFYDWLYINSLKQNPRLADALINYNCFTDIEFNPKRSINCQAYSAALYVYLQKQGELENATETQESFLYFLRDIPDWLSVSEYSKYHDTDRLC